MTKLKTPVKKYLLGSLDALGEQCAEMVHDIIDKKDLEELRTNAAALSSIVDSIYWKVNSELRKEND